MHYKKGSLIGKAIRLSILLFIFIWIRPVFAVTITDLVPNVPVTGDLVGTSDAKYYRINVASGTNLFINVDGDSQNDDIYLYVKYGTTPTSSDNDAKSTNQSPSQAVAITNTQAGYYYIMVYGAYIYTSSTGEFTIAASVEGYTSISGTITMNSLGLADVTVALSGNATSTTTTDSDGHYSFVGLSQGNYTVTPNKVGYTFKPPSQQVNVTGTVATGIDFVASACATWSDVIEKYNEYVNCSSGLQTTK